MGDCGVVTQRMEMSPIEKPDTPGSPGEKAEKALGEKLNRPTKPSPPMPDGRKAAGNEPAARRVTDEVNDL